MVFSKNKLILKILISLHFRHLFNPFEHYMSSDSTLLTFDIPSYSTFCTIRHFFIWRFVPLGYFSIRHCVPFGVFSIRHFLLFDLLSQSTLVPFDVLYHSAFFPFDVLSHSAFCLSMFCRSTFCPFGVCYFDILSVNRKFVVVATRKNYILYTFFVRTTKTSFVTTTRKT